VNSLTTTTAAGINDSPAFIYFLKDKDENGEAVKKNIEEVAKPYIKEFEENGGNGKQVLFFYHRPEEDEDEVGSSLKSFAGIGSDDNLVLIDVPEQSVRPAKVCVVVCTDVNEFKWLIQLLLVVARPLLLYHCYLVGA